MKKVGFSHIFSRFAQSISYAAGTWQAFILAFLLIVIWLAAGLYYGYDNQLYELLINSATTVITFLMVFILQHSQNRDTTSIKIQLGELVRATTDARNDLISLEHLTESQLKDLAALYETRAKAQNNPPGDDA